MATGAEPLDRHEVGELLRHGRITSHRRIEQASNLTLSAVLVGEGRELACVVKPVAGERPLWDFPDGTLADREFAAAVVDEAIGWGIVPDCLIRDDPRFGRALCQLWIESDPAVPPPVVLLPPEDLPPGYLAAGYGHSPAGSPIVLAHGDDAKLRRIALFDAIINNGDRKGSHLLRSHGGRIFGIDHGVAFHEDDKLRTVLWGWAGKPMTADETGALEALLHQWAPLALRLAPHLTAAEIEALRDRVGRLLESAAMPQPAEGWPRLPWPPL